MSAAFPTALAGAPSFSETDVEVLVVELFPK